MQRKILFVVNNAAFFCSHRLPLALAARDRGWSVALVTGQMGSEILESAAVERLRQAEIPHHRTAFSSGRISPIAEIVGFLGILYRMILWRPHFVHCASPKGVIYGGIAARLTRRPALVVAVSGMGSLFIGESRGLKKILRKIYLSCFRFAVNHSNCRIIVQNSDDENLVAALRQRHADGIVLVPGSGVDLKAFAYSDWARRQNRVLFPARLLKDKGIREFVEAARLLQQAGCEWQFVIAGTIDYDNPSMISKTELDEWIKCGWVEWVGHLENIAAEMAKAKIVCLPSYREGMPKSLLEAAASGCAIVTTDVVGCREAIKEGISGDLVPAENAIALAETLGKLIDDPERQQSYGKAGRQLAEERFGIQAVISTTLKIYEALWRSNTGKISIKY